MRQSGATKSIPKVKADTLCEVSRLFLVALCPVVGQICILSPSLPNCGWKWILRNTEKSLFGPPYLVTRMRLKRDSLGPCLLSTAIAYHLQCALIWLDCGPQMIEKWMDDVVSCGEGYSSLTTTHKSRLHFAHLHLSCFMYLSRLWSRLLSLENSLCRQASQRCWQNPFCGNG